MSKGYSTVHFITLSCSVLAATQTFEVSPELGVIYYAEATRAIIVSLIIIIAN